MQIILEGEEAQAYQDQKVREAILAETSKFPENMKLPEGCKPRPIPLSDESKADIKRLHDTGMMRGQIAKELHLPVKQVGGVVQAYIMNVLRRRPVEPKIEGLQPTKPLIPPETEKPAKTRQDRIDSIILSMHAKGARYSSIAAEICNRMGGAWMPEHVSARLKELRSVNGKD